MLFSLKPTLVQMKLGWSRVPGHPKGWQEDLLRALKVTRQQDPQNRSLQVLHRGEGEVLQMVLIDYGAD